MARRGTLTVRLVGDDKPLQRTLGGVGRSLGRFTAGVAAAGAAAAGTVVAAGLQAAREAQQINRITENVIRTTGGAANVTAQQVDDLSGRLQRLTGVSDETIQRGSNMLLTFTNIRNEVGEGNDVFDQATALALDMSVAMGTDVKDSAIQLGKALNDPIRGISALSRAGIQFTDQQKEQIEALVESGDQLGAQKIILEELGTQFGGTAEAAADPVQKLQSTIGDVVETIGVAALPALNAASTWLGEHLPAAVDTAMTWIRQNLVPAFQTIAAWWSENSPAILEFVGGLWDGIKTVFDNIVGAVQTVIGWFQTNREDVGEATSGLWEDIEPIWDGIYETIKTAVELIQEVVERVVGAVQEFWDRFGEHILSFITETWDNIVQVVDGAIRAVKGVLDVVIGLITLDWDRVWEGIKGIFGGVWDAIVGIVDQAIDTVSTIIGGTIAAISQTWETVWDGIKSFFGGVWDGMVDIAKGAVNTIIGFINAIIRAWNSLDFTVPSVSIPGIGTVGGQTLGLPDISEIPTLHGGGTFRAPAGRREGLALLEDGEHVTARGGRDRELALLERIAVGLERAGLVSEADMISAVRAS